MRCTLINPDPMLRMFLLCPNLWHTFDAMPSNVSDFFRTAKKAPCSESCLDQHQTGVLVGKINDNYYSSMVTCNTGQITKNNIMCI